MEKLIEAENQHIAIFQSEDGGISFDVTLQNETVWLTQKQMAELFDKHITTVGDHIANIFKENELKEHSVVGNFPITASDGKTYSAMHYSLDVIISVGYRVKSKRGTQFRQWALNVLKDHLIKGYTVNTKRLLEQKIELEIRESSKMVEQVLLMKGLGKDADSQAVIDTVSTYLGKTQDQETTVLKAHILTERFLVQFLKRQAKNEKILDNARFTYRNLLAMSQLQHAPTDKLWVWELLKKLNKIRDAYAHTLEVEGVDDDINEFTRICIVRLEKEGVSIDSGSNDLKTVLVHLCGAVFSALQESTNTPSQ